MMDARWIKEEFEDNGVHGGGLVSCLLFATQDAGRPFPDMEAEVRLLGVKEPRSHEGGGLGSRVVGNPAILGWAKGV